MKRSDISRRNFGRQTLATVMGAVALTTVGPAAAAPSAEVWSRWTKNVAGRTVWRL